MFCCSPLDCSCKSCDGEFFAAFDFFISAVATQERGLYSWQQNWERESFGTKKEKRIQSEKGKKKEWRKTTYEYRKREWNF